MVFLSLLYRKFFSSTINFTYFLRQRESTFPTAGCLPKCPQQLGAGLGQSWEPGASSGILVWVAEAQELEPCFAAFPDSISSELDWKPISRDWNQCLIWDVPSHGLTHFNLKGTLTVLGWRANPSTSCGSIRWGKLTRSSSGTWFCVHDLEPVCC